jgi:glycogen(starch) synthase
MLILHLSWEYPPIVYGGLGRHVHALAEQQAVQGHEVVVVTQTEGAPGTAKIAGVTVVRAPRDVPFVPLDNTNLLTWVSGLEHSMTRSVVRLSRHWRPDVIHAHDWMVAHVAAAAGDVFRRPVVTTFHATEAGRHQGWLPPGLPQSIHAVEWWLSANSTRVVTCSSHMRWETNRLFGVGLQKSDVVPNGINPARWSIDHDISATGPKCRPTEGPMIVFTGRLEWEKGVHILLDAIALLKKQHPNVRLAIAGKGGKALELRRQCHRLKLGKSVSFEGWLPERELHALVAEADVAVVPSLYEPFGLVALEAVALGTPIVVSGTGGLTEIADNDRVGLTFLRGDAESLATTIDSVLVDTEATSKRMATAARALSDRYSWERVAEATSRTYEKAILHWEEEGAPEVPDRPPSPPAGNLLDEDF